MTRVLVATASVHTTAAACDYLGPRLGADASVVVLTVPEGDVADRDAGDAANVARTRLFEPSVDAVTREGNSASVIREVAREEVVDEIVVGTHRGDPDVAGDPPGSTTRALLTDPPTPVVVVPL